MSMKKYLSFFLILIFSLSTTLFADRSEMLVGKIDITIKKDTKNQVIDKQSILKRLKTKAGAPFSQIDFDEDLKMLVDEYDNVEPTLTFAGKVVNISLEIFPKLVIKKIHWCGNKNISSSDLSDELAITEGSFLDRFAFSEAFHKLRSYYIKNGYFEAELSYKIIESECNNEVTIEVQIKEGPSGKIKQICVVGVDGCEERKILELMATKEYCFFTSWYTKAGIFQPEALERDRIVITDYLQNEGWADAKVSINVYDSCEKDKIDIKVSVCKGERYYYGTITFSGNQIFCDEMVTTHLKAKEGCPFSPEKLREAIKGLTDYMGSKGYIEASVNFTPNLRECANVYDVHFVIEEGHCYRVGLVKVFGNTCTTTPVILHECLMVPGDVFDSRKLEGTECRIKQMGFFECVNVYPVKSQQECYNSCERYRDVHIEVKETYTGTIGAFFGFSTIESLFGGLDLTERNFNYKGFASVFNRGLGALRGNGEYLQLRASVGMKTSSYLVRWTKPYFLDSKWIVGFDLEHTANRAISDNFDVLSTAVKMHTTYAMNDFLRYGWAYRLQRSYTHSNVTIQPGSNNGEIYNKGTVSALGPRITYDSTNCVYNPTNGLRSELTFEYAGLGGDYNFYSLAYLNTLYVPISSKGTTKFRLDAQFIKPLGNTYESELPMGEKLFLGGETTVRGYRPYSITPLLDNDTPAGGISSLLLSAEYSHKLMSRVYGFTFFDSGSVTTDAFHLSSLRSSYGVGLRIEVMENTPIVIGMGWPFNTAYSEQIKRFFISFGGRF